MTTTDRRTQQQRRDQAEAALLNAAAELVVEQGVHSLTLARVGERARYSRGLVTHYFGSKQALLQRLARTAQSGFVPGLDAMPPGLDRLLRLIDGYIGALSQLRMANRAFLLLWAEAATAADLARIFRERDEAFRAGLREDVTAGIADGTIRADAAAEETAVAVLAQLRGIGLQRLVDSPASRRAGRGGCRWPRRSRGAGCPRPQPRASSTALPARRGRLQRFPRHCGPGGCPCAHRRREGPGPPRWPAGPSSRSPRRTFVPSADTAAAAVSDRARPVTSCPAAMSSGMM
jgi:AcrR family transcriptional regulator